MQKDTIFAYSSPPCQISHYSQDFSTLKTDLSGRREGYGGGEDRKTHSQFFGINPVIIIYKVIFSAIFVLELFIVTK